ERREAGTRGRRGCLRARWRLRRRADRRAARPRDPRRGRRRGARGGRGRDRCRGPVRGGQGRRHSDPSPAGPHHRRRLRGRRGRRTRRAADTAGRPVGERAGRRRRGHAFPGRGGAGPGRRGPPEALHRPVPARGRRRAPQGHLARPPRAHHLHDGGDRVRGVHGGARVRTRPDLRPGRDRRLRL
ncbi:MAG: Protein translocase subunit SecE, partial [uncultured Blastococcus sp.]